jgi:hypothetical protein
VLADKERNPQDGSGVVVGGSVVVADFELVADAK